MKKIKPTVQLLFKVEGNKELKVFFEVLKKALKSQDSIVETKLNTIKVKLYGDKGEIEKIANRLKHYHGLIKNTFQKRQGNKNVISLELLQILSGRFLDIQFFSQVLHIFNEEVKVIDDFIETKLSFEEMLAQYEKTHQKYQNTLINENRDVRKLVTALLLYFPAATEKQIVSYGLAQKLFAIKNGKIYFMASPEVIFQKFKSEFPNENQNKIFENNEIEKEIEDRLFFDGGGKIIIRDLRKQEE